LITGIFMLRLYPASTLDAIINDSLGLSFTSRNCFRPTSLTLHVTPSRSFISPSIVRERVWRCFTSSENSSFVNFHLHFQRIEILLAVDYQQVMGLDTLYPHNDRFDLRRKDVDPANYHHVVAAAAHPGDPGMGPATDTWFVGDAGNVPGAIADQRDAFLGNGCDYQFTLLTL
jgi:hypothetical protein